MTYHPFMREIILIQLEFRMQVDLEEKNVQNQFLLVKLEMIE